MDSYVFSPTKFLLFFLFSLFFSRGHLFGTYLLFILSLSRQGAFGASSPAAAKPQNAGYGFGGGSLGGPAGKEDPFASIGLASSAPQRGGASASSPMGRAPMGNGMGMGMGMQQPQFFGQPQMNPMMMNGGMQMNPQQMQQMQMQQMMMMQQQQQRPFGM
jgi:hypothetical protein